MKVRLNKMLRIQDKGSIFRGLRTRTTIPKPAIFKKFIVPYPIADPCGLWFPNFIQVHLSRSGSKVKGLEFRQSRLMFS